MAWPSVRGSCLGEACVAVVTYNRANFGRGRWRPLGDGIWDGYVCVGILGVIGVLALDDFRCLAANFNEYQILSKKLEKKYERACALSFWFVRTGCTLYRGFQMARL